MKQTNDLFVTLLVREIRSEMRADAGFNIKVPFCDSDCVYLPRYDVQLRAPPFSIYAFSG
jgi:hypothetical protein